MTRRDFSQFTHERTRQKLTDAFDVPIFAV